MPQNLAQEETFKKEPGLTCWQYCGRARDIRMLTNIYNAPAEGNFCNEGGKAVKPQIMMDYNHHMGYVDKGDRMANSYSISLRTFKWMKKLFVC